MTPFVPTEDQRRQVEMMAGIGLTHDEIAALTINPRTKRGINKETLERHFRAELDAGAPKAKARIYQSIYRKATSDGPQAVTAAMFLLRCRYGWRYDDRVVHEHESKSGVLVVPAAVSVDDWLRRQREVDAAADLEPPRRDA